MIDKPLVDQIYSANFVVRAGHQDDAVGLQALVLASGEFALDRTVLVDQCSAQAVASRTTLPESQLDQPALPSEHLGGQLPAVFASHCPFDTFDDGGDRRTVIFELLGAVGNLDAGTAADVLVIGALIGILEAPPATDVVNKDDLKVGFARLDITE